MADATVALVASMQVQLNDLQKQMDKAGQIAEQGVRNIEHKFSEANVGSNLGENIRKGLELFAVAETANRIREIVKSITELNDEAERVGVSAEFLQQFQFAVEKTGGTAEEASNGLEFFAKSLSQAQAGGGQLLKVFELNHIALRNAHGDFISVTDALGKYMELVKNAPNAQDRLNLSVIAFGRNAGPELVNLLKEGREGMQEFADQADRLGIILSDKTVKSVADLNSKISDLEKQWDISWKLMAISVAEKVPEILKYLEPVANFLNRLTVTVDAFGKALHNALETGTFNTPTARDVGIGLLKLGPGAGATRIGPQADPFGTGGNVPTSDITSIYNALGFRREAEGPPIPTRTPPPQGGGGGRTAIDRGPEVIAQLQLELEKVTAIGDAKDDIIAKEKVLQELRSAGVNATEEEKKKITELATELVKAQQEQAKLVKAMDDFRDVAGSAINTFADDLLAGKSAVESLNDALKNVLQTILQIAERQLLTGLLGESGTGGGGLFGNFFAGLFHRQGGGPVQAGQAYVVGEHGPELMVPSSAGAIIPNGAYGSGQGGGVQINIINQSGAQIKQRERSQGGRPVIDILVAEMGKRIGGGDFDSAMRGRYGARPVKVR